MSKTASVADKRAGGPHPAQAPLPFCPNEPSLAVLVKRAAGKDLKQSKVSRAEIAWRLSAAAGRPITVAQLDALTAETKPHRFSLDLLPEWVRVTGSARLLELICRRAGYWLAGDLEHDLAELARAEFARQKLATRISVLQSRLEKEV